MPASLAIIAERYGRVGSVESILPEFVAGVDEHGGRNAPWPSAVGMIHTGDIITDFNMGDFAPQLLASIIILRDDRSWPIDITEMHGVMFFRPIEGYKWNEQVSTLKTNPSLFEVVPVTRLESNKDYAFFARRAAKTQRSKRKVLA